MIKEFKAGDKVYCLGHDWETKIYTVERAVYASQYPVAIETNDTFTVEGKLYKYSEVPSMVYATKENYDLLCKLFPNQAWERPPEQPTPKEVIQAMLDDGNVVLGD